MLCWRMRPLLKCFALILLASISAYSQPEELKVQDFSPMGSPREALAWRWAPAVIHGVGTDPMADVITRVDFDGDWDSSNNWDHLKTHPLPPAAYFEVFETETHFFLVYAFFHPRDVAPLCLPIICHENDMEGAGIVLSKTPGEPRFEALATFGHDHFALQLAPIRKSWRDKDLERIGIYIEANGHGIQAQLKPEISSRQTLLVPSKSTQAAGGYVLLPLAELWNHRDSPGFMTGRHDFHGKHFRIARVPSAFDGKKWAKARANPPWSWTEKRDPEREKGDWFWDPALWYYGRLGQPKIFSFDYLRHPLR